ncbi:FAD-dependent monooxygenase [Microlunatus sp. Y2014]|uniref:FAD-dependent monooxygenase n=1 Tax=Microlunatus sp. Y2014 TaxID=3418488 RepID=UPI003DA728FA
MGTSTTPTERSTDVLVVGAGPTGLMLANWLQRLGVDHVIVDDGDAPTRESRAIILQSRSMELYAQLGMVDAVRDRATTAKGVRPGWLDRQAPGWVPVQALGRGQTPYPGFFTVEQSVNEQLLVDHLVATGGDVTWGRRVTDLATVPDGVRARVSGPVGEEVITARHCVGADGARSVVRKAAGIEFSGVTNPETFYVIDAEEVDGLDHEVINLRPGRNEFLVTFPMTGDRHHRLIGSLGEDETEADVRQLLGERYGVTWGRSGWFAEYRLHHRVADRFRTGPFLLAGDAAHVHSPVGGQGMNTGLQDAHNLAFKLAAVVHGEADDRLLDAYEAERRPVAQRLVETTDAAFRLVVDQSRRAIATRRWVIPAVVPIAVRVVPRLPVAEAVAGLVGQWRIHYRPPAGLVLRTGNPWDRINQRALGRRLPWTGNNHDVLTALCWQVHAYGDDLPSLAGLPGQVTRAHRFEARPDLGLGPGVWYLVRPDGFVQAAATPTDAPAVFAAHLHALGHRLVRTSSAAATRLASDAATSG